MKKILKVEYTGELDEKLDEAITDCLSGFGFKKYASGYDFIDNERDLAFEKKE